MEGKRQAFFSGSNYLLGALYGTLAQNYGFCGPTHLSAVLEMLARAEDAFGGKYYLEKERLINYRIYALLDSGMARDTTSLLNDYLGLNSEAGQDDWFQEVQNLLTTKNSTNVFKAALALRVLADTGYHPSLPKNTGLNCVPALLEQTSHPWQLIALNLGKILLSVNQSNEAEELFRHSVHACLSGGDTLQPMGLLALAELHAAGLANTYDYQKIQEIIRWLGQTTALNTKHFRPILDTATPESLLEEVMKKRNTLFPFSYR